MASHQLMACNYCHHCLAAAEQDAFLSSLEQGVQTYYGHAASNSMFKSCSTVPMALDLNVGASVEARPLSLRAGSTQE
jgi:hypothetical protein